MKKKQPTQQSQASRQRRNAYYTLAPKRVHESGRTLICPCRKVRVQIENEMPEFITCAFCGESFNVEQAAIDGGAQ